MKRRKLEVTWQDAAAFLGPWDDIEAVLAKKARGLVLVHSVGYVLASDRGVLVLARSIHGSRVGGVAIIPKRAIVKRRRLR
jgi:hypothetical protein